MRKKEEPALEAVCPRCHEASPPDKLKKCLICHSIHCRKCAFFGYGRDFCSNRCAEFFFHGDEDDLGEEE